MACLNSHIFCVAAAVWFFQVIHILVSFSSKFNEFDNDFWLQVTCCKVFSDYLKFAVFWIRNIPVCVFSQWDLIRRITSKSRYLDRMQKNKDQNKQNIWIRTLFEQCNSPEFIRCFIDTWNASKLIMHKISEKRYPCKLSTATKVLRGLLYFLDLFVLWELKVKLNISKAQM